MSVLWVERLKLPIKGRHPKEALEGKIYRLPFNPVSKTSFIFQRYASETFKDITKNEKAAPKVSGRLSHSQKQRCFVAGGRLRSVCSSFDHHQEHSSRIHQKRQFSTNAVNHESDRDYDQENPSSHLDRLR